MICVGEMLHDVIGCCRRKQEFALYLVRVTPIEQEVHKMAIVAPICSKTHRGAKVMVLLYSYYNIVCH